MSCAPGSGVEGGREGERCQRYAQRREGGRGARVRVCVCACEREHACDARTVNEDLRLDNRDEAVLLADARVAGEVLRGDVDREVGRAARLDVDLERRAPLGEARALLVVLGGALREVVEAGAPLLALATAEERAEAGVDLDARDDADAVEHVDEGLARRVLLVEGLLEEDRARDVLADALRGEEEVAPRHAVLLGVLHAVRLEARADRAGRLIAGQQALAGLDHRGGGRTELLRVLARVDRRRVRRRHDDGSVAAHRRGREARLEGEDGGRQGEHCVLSERAVGAIEMDV